MLISLHHKFAFLATPKTGSTALEMALQPHCEIAFRHSRKHMMAMRYKRKVLPFIQDTFGVTPTSIAVIREPLDQLRSWYRFRSRQQVIHRKVSTASISFEEFIRELVSEDAPPRSRLGSQHTFLTNRTGEVLVDRLFSYAHQDELLGYLSDLIKAPLVPKQRNVSPDLPTPLSAEAEALLRQARAPEFELYDKVMASGGHLQLSADDVPASAATDLP